MAEYIDREQLLELINEDCKYQNPTNEYTRGCNEVCDWAIKTIKNIPTADVVPKSEVERLEEKCAILNEKNAQLALALFRDFPTTKELEVWEACEAVKTKVAREIFEEIEKTVEDAEFEWGTIYGVKLCLAELKKKYTESENG